MGRNHVWEVPMQVPTQSSGVARELRLPRGVALRQDEEWCEVRSDGDAQRVRFHDYGRIFAVPGLYERLFRDELCCDSPRVVCDLLEEAVSARSARLGSLRVLDVGAGNGMVAEELATRGVDRIVGVDRLPEAAMAAERDRPGVYQDYHVVDLANPSEDTRHALRRGAFDCLTMVGALGFADIPPRIFGAALSYLTTPAWVTFNVKEDFLAESDETGFAEFLARCVAHGALRPLARQRYRHRLAVSGEPLYYVAYVTEKTAEPDPEWVPHGR